MLRLFIFTICLLHLSISFGQYNLVRNHSFEDSFTCVSNTIGKLPPPWLSSVKQDTTPLFHTCSISPIASVPYNYLGGLSYQQPKTGNAYSIINSGYTIEQRSYIQAKLKDSLRKNKSYYCEFWTSLGNPAKWACNNIAMLCSDTLVFTNSIELINAYPQIYNYGNPIITDTLNWIKVSAIYNAKGGESYILIGNFRSNSNTSFSIFDPNAIFDVGYYIDDVSVIPLDSFNLKADAGLDKAIALGDSAFIGTFTNGIDTIKWQILNTNNTIDTTSPGFWVHPISYTCYVLTQKVNGFISSDTVCITVNPLPLKFLSLSIFPTFGGVRSGWQTANEINVSHFKIQRSVNGKEFINIAQQKAQNNNYNEYTYSDMQPLNGDNYYRIQSIDKDGKTSYTETKKITINYKQQTIGIYPNPATTTINITSQQNIQQIKLINQLGQTLQQFNNLITKHQTINIKQFSKGIYVVQITTLNGEIKTQKIVIE